MADQPVSEHLLKYSVDEGSVSASVAAVNRIKAGFGDLSKVLSNRYTIERELGAGGMATVYLAEDVKHHRKVAVKVLRLPTYERGADGKWKELRAVHTPHPKAPDYWPYAGITGSVAMVEVVF